MAKEACLMVYFNDGSHLIFEYPKQAGNDPATIAANVRKALEKDKLAAEVDGDLVVIPLQNVKYVRVSPAPDALPEGIIKNVSIVE
ncbi:hypothetical protein [Kaarinaea lacus]